MDKGLILYRYTACYLWWCPAFGKTQLKLVMNGWVQGMERMDAASQKNLQKQSLCVGWANMNVTQTTRQNNPHMTKHGGQTTEICQTVNISSWWSSQDCSVLAVCARLVWHAALGVESQRSQQLLGSKLKICLLCTSKKLKVHRM